jgi:branched-chain amino acid aminotransferase
MSECCIGKFFINNEIKDRKDFDETIFTSGRSIYEVIRIINRKPVSIERHIQRLQNTANLENVELWLTEDEIKKRISRLLIINNIEFGNIKLVFNYRPDNGYKKIFLAYCLDSTYPTQKQYREGVSTISYRAERKNPNAKVINALLRSTINTALQDKDVYEALLVDHKLNLREGSRSNLFLIKNGKVYTPEVKDVLPGITRAYIIEICRKKGIEIIETNISYNELRDYEAVFLTGTSPKVLPVNRIDDIEFKTDNKIMRSIMDEYAKLINNYKTQS